MAGSRQGGLSSLESWLHVLRVLDRAGVEPTDLEARGLLSRVYLLCVHTTTRLNSRSQLIDDRVRTELTAFMAGFAEYVNEG